MNLRYLGCAWSTALLMSLAIASAGQTASRKTHYNVSRGIAIGGYDPVSYFTNDPTEGSDRYKLSYQGITYLFSSQANMDLFRSNPGKYEPAYGGWCAYAMGESGEKVKIDPETYKIIDGTLYLFYNFWGNNTLRSWNKDESNLKTAADRNWRATVGRQAAPD